MNPNKRFLIFILYTRNNALIIHYYFIFSNEPAETIIEKIETLHIITELIILRATLNIKCISKYTNKKLEIVHSEK